VSHRVKTTPSARELDILDALWHLGSGTVADVRDFITHVREEDLEYTTVLTNLRTLDDKGWVRRSKEGRAHRYFPAVGREYARATAVYDLTHALYDGSKEDLLTHLLSDKRLHPRLLARMRLLIDTRLKLATR
jgi:predicted transcriptional regulator